MGSRRSSELFGHLETLFRVGAVGGLSDAQLLERFVAGRDEAGEAAFRALVARHGPMVLRVCRSVLARPARRRGRFSGDVPGPGAEGRLDPQTRFDRELAARDRPSCGQEGQDRGPKAPGAGVAGGAAAEAAVSSESEPTIEDRELSPILHEEIERLPAKYRAPIVLCYLEGMTQDQAAFELGWPVGTVRGRLARARDLLRSRLTRRGLALSAGLAASGSPADAASAGAVGRAGRSDGRGRAWPVGSFGIVADRGPAARRPSSATWPSPDGLSSPRRCC